MFSDNHAAEAIPAEESVSAFRVAQIYVGVAITLPAFLLAAQIFFNLGFRDGLIVLAVSSAILVMISSLTMTVGARKRLSTYAIIHRAFGAVPAVAINVGLGLTLLGWFAVTVSLFAEALTRASLSVSGTTLPIWSLKAIGGVSMIGFTLFGFRLIDSLSRIAVPLMTLVLVIAFFVIFRFTDMSAVFALDGARESIGSIGMGVSICIGAFMVGLTIAPDIARFLNSSWGGVSASILSYGIGAPLVLILAGAPVLATGEADFVENLAASGLGWPALFVVVFATITTNVSNLYSTSLSFKQLSERTPDYVVTIVCGATGTTLALLGIETLFVPFLVLLSVAVPPIAGVYIAHSLEQRAPVSAQQRTVWSALFALMIGTGVALLATNGFLTLSHVPAIDGFATGFVFCSLFSKAFNGRR